MNFGFFTESFNKADKERKDFFEKMRMFSPYFYDQKISFSSFEEFHNLVKALVIIPTTALYLFLKNINELTKNILLMVDGIFCISPHLFKEGLLEGIKSFRDMIVQLPYLVFLEGLIFFTLLAQSIATFFSLGNSLINSFFAGDTNSAATSLNI